MWLAQSEVLINYDPYGLRSVWRVGLFTHNREQNNDDDDDDNNDAAANNNRRIMGKSYEYGR